LSRRGGKKEEVLLPLPVEAALRLPFKIDPTADQIATQFLFGDQKFAANVFASSSIVSVGMRCAMTWHSHRPAKTHSVGWRCPVQEDARRQIRDG
jgi:hypothetical protein